jgi:hypothetical protein
VKENIFNLIVRRGVSITTVDEGKTWRVDGPTMKIRGFWFSEVNDDVRARDLEKTIRKLCSAVKSDTKVARSRKKT